MEKAATRLLVLALGVEITGILVVVAGIGLELGTKAHVGFVVITAGSLAIAGGSLLWAKVAKLL